ncbi:MAG: acetylglutamate kinase [Christensenellaceae bacterium]|nr:acetylglutamate kinase [Christensenellaceae bacterium]
MDLKIVKVDFKNPDFKGLKEELEKYLDVQYKKYNPQLRAKYREADADINLAGAYVAYDEGVPIGCCGFIIKDNEVAELKKMFVKEGFGGIGIATSLISMVEDDARECGMKKMVLKTGEPLRAAVDLYRSVGYAIIKNYSPYEADPTAVCMAKSLIKINVWSAEKRNAAREALGYLNLYRGKIFVIKYDGEAIAERSAHESVLHDIKILAQSGIKIVLVHGGKPYIEKEIKNSGVISEMVEGRRVTTPKVMDIIKETYLELINPRLVSLMDGAGIGISGINGHFLMCEKKKIDGQCMGFLGKIKSVDRSLLDKLLNDGFIPVVSPLGVGSDGYIYNINPEDAAASIAKEMKAEKLIFLSTVDGILDKSGNLMYEIDIAEAEKLREDKQISENLYPKFDVTVDALQNGVSAVHIINGTKQDSLFDEIISHSGVGTMFTDKKAAAKRRLIVDNLKRG